MSAEQITSKVISLSSLKEVATNKPNFTAFHAFEPNGHLTLAHALRYAIASKAVNECGGKYILFIDDVRSSEDMFFKDIELPKPKQPKEEAGEKGKKEKKAKKVKLTAQEEKELRRDCIKKSIDYSMKVFEVLGVLGPHQIKRIFFE